MKEVKRERERGRVGCVVRGREREREKGNQCYLDGERELLCYVSLSDRGASDRTLVTASRQ